MFEFREAMLDPQLRAGEVEGMGAKRLMSGQLLLNLGDRPAAMRRRELKPIVGQDRVDRVRDTLDQPAQEVRRDPWSRSFVSFREGEMADAIDGDDELELAFVRPDLREIDVDVPDRIVVELPTHARALRIRQAADALALKQAVQGGPGQVWDGRLQGVEAIIEGQQRVSTKRDAEELLLSRQHRRVR